MPSGGLQTARLLAAGGARESRSGVLQLRQLRISVKAPVTPPSVHVPSMTRL
jgi:hypothetical protein